MPYTPDIDVYMEFGDGVLRSVGEDVLITRADIVASWGQTRSDPLSRVASTGVITFLLNNSASNSDGNIGYYSPLHADTRLGFDVGNPVVLWMKYGAIIKFKRYYVTNIVPVSGVNRERQTAITATDFMGELAKQRENAFVAGAYVRTDLAMAALIPTMAMPPLAHSYSLSPDAIQYALNDIGPGTTFLTACQHLALTDAGNIFTKGDTDPANGMEKLIDGGLEIWSSASDLTNWTEGGTVARETVNIYSGTYSAYLYKAGSASNITQDITMIAGFKYLISGWLKVTAGTGYLQIRAGATQRYLHTTNNGVTEYFSEYYTAIGDETTIRATTTSSGKTYADAISIKEQTGEILCYENRTERFARGSLATFDNTMVDFHSPYDAEKIFNDINCPYYPITNSDPVVEVLYIAPEEIKIPAGDYINFRVDFVDPTPGSLSGVALVNGSELCVAGTDYKVTATQGSGGNDAIGVFTLVNGYLAKCCYVNMANVAAYDIWVAPFQIRGFILRTLPAQTEYVTDTAPNLAKFGVHRLDYPMYYQNDPFYVGPMLSFWFNRFANPASYLRAEYMDFIANTSDYLMNAAINLDIGDKITIDETVTGAAADFRIIGIRMTVKNGTALYVRYYLESDW